MFVVAESYQLSGDAIPTHSGMLFISPNGKNDAKNK